MSGTSWKLRALAAAFAVGQLLGPTAVLGQEAAKPKVVATFSILADMTQEVAGDRIELSVLVGPNGDAHLFDPRPSHARALVDADLLIANGLGLEQFLPGLVESSGFDGKIVIASQGIVPRPFDDQTRDDALARHRPTSGDDRPPGRDGAAETQIEAAGENVHGGTIYKLDPHAWLDLTNARTYVRNIADGLARQDPENASAYRMNADRYIAEIDALDAELRRIFSTVPEERRLIITSHDAFGYFGAAYGLRFEGASGITTADDPSAGDVAALIRKIRAGGVRALFVEHAVNPALIEQIASETGARIGGELYPDALTTESGSAPSFLEMMRHNAITIATALLGG